MQNFARGEEPFIATFPMVMNAAFGCSARCPQNGHTRGKTISGGKKTNAQVIRWASFLITHTNCFGVNVSLLSLPEAYIYYKAWSRWREIYLTISCRDAAVALNAGKEFSYQLQHLTEDVLSVAFVIFCWSGRQRFYEYQKVVLSVRGLNGDAHTCSHQPAAR